MSAIIAQPVEGEGGGDIELGGGLTSTLLDPITVTLVEQDLTQMAGVVIRQEVITTEVMAQALGVPYEAKNKYKISSLPGNKRVPSSQGDIAAWSPTNTELDALPTLLYAHEQSDCMTRSVFDRMEYHALAQGSDPTFVSTAHPPVAWR